MLKPLVNIQRVSSHKNVPISQKECLYLIISVSFSKKCKFFSTLQSTACGQYLVSRAALRLFLAERCEQDFSQNITIHYGYNLATIDDAKNSATFERSKCKAPTRAATAPLTPQLSINDPILESSRSSSSGTDSDGASGSGVEQEEFISDSFVDED